MGALSFLFYLAILFSVSTGLIVVFNLGSPEFAILPAVFLLPAWLVILVWFILRFRFKWFAEGFIVAVINAFSAVAYTMFVNEMISNGELFSVLHQLGNYTIASISKSLFSPMGFVGFVSGLLIYLGAMLWNSHRIGAGLSLFLGWMLFFASAMLYLLYSVLNSAA